MSQARRRILVVDDDPTVAEVVSRYLDREGFDVVTVGDGHAALQEAAARPPDLVILDLMLPGIDGLEVYRRLRQLGPIPVVMLTARGDESDRVVGLELGADDYVAKPFSPRELTARVKAVLRRATTPDPSTFPHHGGVLRAGDLLLDLPAHEARVGGDLITLTAKEFELLAYLMVHPRRAFSREELLEDVWGYTYGDTSTVTVHVRRLREKTEAEPSSPRHLTTVWGVGYRWDP